MCRPLILSAALAAALQVAAPAWGEGPGPGLRPVLREAALSAELYSRGLAAGDPVLVLAAARMRKALDYLPEGVGPLTGWQEMADSARRLAGDDPALQALIDDSLAEASKGVLIGPTYMTASFASPADPSVVEFDYKGGQLAEVYVEGTPGSNIDIQVRDGAGNLICTDTHPSHVAYCVWTPATDGVFTVTVVNRSGTADEFVLITN